MIPKKYSLPFFMLLFLGFVGLVLGMDPVVQKSKLSPVNQVFIQACENDKDIEFIKMRADQKCVDPKNGYTGLHYACKNGNLKRIIYFLGHVFEVTITSQDSIMVNDLIGFDVIGMIRDAGHIKVAQALMDIVLISTRKAPFSSESFKSELMWLFQQGIDNNVHSPHFVAHPDLVGFTPLHYACLRDNFSMVKFLVENGADIYKLSKSQITLPQITRNKEIKDLLLQTQLDDNLLTLCSEGASLDFKDFERAATILLKQGANINAKSKAFIEPNPDLRGCSPLVYACADAEIERVKFLVSNGAEVNQKTAQGVFPLYALFSARAGGNDESKRFEIMKYLIAHGADLTLSGPEQHSIFAVIIASKSIRSAKFIVSKNIEVNGIDKYSHNALYEAVSYNMTDVVPFLFELGVKPPVDNEGVSLMHVAAIKDNITIVKELIARGLSVNVVDNNQQTPLHYASQHAGKQMIITLLSAGADITAVDQYGNTPLDLSNNNPSKHVGLHLKKAHKHTAFLSTIDRAKQTTADACTHEKQEKIPHKETGKKKLAKKKPKKNKKKKEKNLLEEPGKILIEDHVLSSDQYNDTPEDSIERPLQEEVAVIQTPPQIEIQDQAIIAALPKMQSKPKKKSVLGYVQDKVQKKVVDLLGAPSTTKTFAQVVSSAADKRVEESRSVTLVDNHVTITIPLPDRSSALLITGKNNNPLKEHSECISKHVQTKMENPYDCGHNFSFKVEDELGGYMIPRIIDSYTTLYTAPAIVTMNDRNKTFTGTIEITKKNQKTVHRFIKFDKKSKKQTPQYPLLQLSSIPENNTEQLFK